MMSSPFGFDAVDAIFATCLVAAAPTLQVMPTSSSTRRRISAATCPGVPHRRRAPETSRNASSIESGSTSGVMLRNTSITCADVSR